MSPAPADRPALSWTTAQTFEEGPLVVRVGEADTGTRMIYSLAVGARRPDGSTGGFIPLRFGRTPEFSFEHDYASILARLIAQAMEWAHARMAPAWRADRERQAERRAVDRDDGQRRAMRQLGGDRGDGRRVGTHGRRA